MNVSIPNTDAAASKPLYRKKWYAIHTRSRHEKKVASLLETSRLEPYLPTRKLIKKWSDRRKLVEFPLFPGYLFVRIPLIEKNRVLHTPGVVRLLGHFAPEPVPDEQIASLKRFENHEVEVDPYLHLQPGRYVRVVRGPFKGCSGVLLRKKTRYRLVVNLKVIMQSVSVEIDASDVVHV
jgi:transcription antitermination factor NusG